MPTTELDDMKVHVKVRLSALWTALMFCYIYGDYFGLYVPGKLIGMINGTGPIGPVTQGTLVEGAVMLAVPGLMVVLTLVLPARISQLSNIILGACYALIMAATMPGAWTFYLVLGSIEIGLSGLIVWSAWRWPRRSS